MKKNFPFLFLVFSIALALVAIFGLVAATVGPPYPAGAGGFVRINHLAVNVNDPDPFTVGTDPVTYMAERPSATEGRVLVRTIQNVGTVPVLFAVGTNVTALKFHGILAPGVAAKDGLGSILDLSNWRGIVTFMTESGTTTLVPMEMTQ